MVPREQNSAINVKDNVHTERKQILKRNFINVPERRLPWCLFKNSGQLSSAQKIKLLMKYKSELSLVLSEKIKDVNSHVRCKNKLDIKMDTKVRKRSIRLKNINTKFSKIGARKKDKMIDDTKLDEIVSNDFGNEDIKAHKKVKNIEETIKLHKKRRTNSND